VIKISVMTTREGLLATIRGKKADRVPFFMEDVFLPHGQVEREARNRGLGVYRKCPSMITTLEKVHITSSRIRTDERKATTFIYETPVGTVSQTLLDAKPFKGRLDGIGGGLTEYFVKKPEDWDVLKFIAENTTYKPYYDRFAYFKKLLGDDGIVTSVVGYHTAYTKLLIDWVGTTRLYVDHVKYPEKVDEVLETITKNQEKQYPIAVESPSDFFEVGDHIDEAFIKPSAFEKYILPVHNKFARMAHAKGKITAIHCDGRLNGLKDLIGELEHDIIHAITPLPIGNLPIKEALEIWPNKILWINFEYYNMGLKAMQKKLLDILRSIIPGYRVVFGPSTERWVPPEYFRLLTKILSQATLPLTEEKIQKIERSL